MSEARSKKRRTVWSESSVAGLLRVPAGPVDLNTYDPRSTPGFAGDKRAGRRQLAAMAAPLSDLQERLFANGRAGAKRRLLLVVQGMDTSGKGGVMRHAVGPTSRRATTVPRARSTRRCRLLSMPSVARPCR